MQKISEQHQKTSKFSLGLERLFSDVRKRLTDTFTSYFNLYFKKVSPIGNQFNLPLIINLNTFSLKLKTPRSTGNVKRGVADLIVTAHNSLSAISARQRRNYNRVFVF